VRNRSETASEVDPFSSDAWYCKDAQFEAKNVSSEDCRQKLSDFRVDHDDDDDERSDAASLECGNGAKERTTLHSWRSTLIKLYIYPRGSSAFVCRHNSFSVPVSIPYNLTLTRQFLDWGMNRSAIGGSGLWLGWKTPLLLV
jgi:hypothetical protein